jgi:hypothetical protein
MLLFHFRKKRKKEGRDIIYVFIYGCCPGGACPAGFVAGFCVNPPPWHTGCCPPGCCPPLFTQFAGDILACTGAATDDTIMATDSATAIAASAVNVTLCVFMSNYNLSHLYKRVLGDF